MANNTISGRVTHKETGRGIPDLLVAIYDTDPGTTSEEESSPAIGRSTTTTASPQTLNVGDSLGSRLTDANGAFEFTYENDEFRVRNPEEKRPHLLLLVLAPEEPGLDLKSRLLFTSEQIRGNAGRIEQYLIRLPGAVLTKAGVPLPVDPTIAKETVQAALGKLADAVAYRVELDQQSKKIAASRVSAARAEAKQADALVETRFVESLTGMTAVEAEKLNMVMPGQKAADVAWRATSKRIDNVINIRPPIVGYIVLSEADAALFRDGSGNYRSNLPASEVEPFLFKTGAGGERPSILTRDLLLGACEAGVEDPLADPDVDPIDPREEGEGGTPPDTDGPVTAQDLPSFVGRILNSMAPAAPIPGATANGRPTVKEVQDSIASLKLGSGPADVVAFHDFHNLQIAFDYVWQQVIDEGIIEAGQVLTREIADQGGDPVAALKADASPLKALRKEARHVELAQRSLQTSGSLARMMVPNDTAVAGDNGTAPTTPRPPVVRPPFVNDAIDPRTLTLAADPARSQGLLAELEAMLSERYKFEVFAPGSSNYGLVVTYRQKWDPVTYQVGDLVQTITLAPKETRKITTKRTVKKDRSVKETENNLRSRKDETRETMRDDAEIVQRAMDKTNFNVNAKGTYNIGIYKGDATTTLDKTAEASSQETKKAFHESVLNAAMELRSEKNWVIETKEAFEDETGETSEISNPNDELTVTYLYYELQRRYKVTEHIHRLSPVVLVAMEVPNPNRAAIDRVLLAHSWIINRVLLDDRYRAPLDYLCTRIVGDELALRELAKNVNAVRAAVDDLKRMYRDLQRELAAREAALTAAIQTRADRVASDNGEGFLEKGFESILGGGSEEDLESVRIIEDMQRDAYERTVREEKDLRMRLDSETAALSAAQQAYAKAYAEHSNRLLEIAGLRVHFKENVLYYMQAIWSFTFKDQIFFSLCNVKVPKLTPTRKTYSLGEAAQVPLSIVAKPGDVVLEVRLDLRLASNLDPAKDFATLAEVADLDNPIGFKGNYMLFPLKKSNALTDFMMMPYIDSELGLHDPDELGAWTPEDFAKHARCLQKKLKGELSEARYIALQQQLREQYKRIVANARPTNDEIIVPTNSLFIEALPGSHPLLEDFKLAHRAADVEKAREETRKLKLESLRYAARILDNVLDDPEVEKKIVVNGPAAGIVVPADDA